MGYTFDMFGRRPVIMINFALMCIFIALIPWTAPSIVALGIMRACLMLSMAFFHSNPLLIDYVKKESRGKATALQGLGNVFGEAVAIQVFFRFTKDWDATSAFGGVAVALAISCFFTMFLISEPPRKISVNRDSMQYLELEDERDQVSAASATINRDSNEVIATSEGPGSIPQYTDRTNVTSFDQMSRTMQIKYLSKRVWETSKSHPKYFLCFIGSMVVRLVTVLFSVYLLLWVTSFVDSGVLESEEEAKTVYQQGVLIALLGTLVMLPIAGIAADRIPPKYVIPVAFVLRGICSFTFMGITSPTSYIAYF